MGLVATSNSMRYGGVFFMAAGIYPSVPSILCILPNNTAGLTKQSVVTALQLMVGNQPGERPKSYTKSTQAKERSSANSCPLKSCLIANCAGFIATFIYTADQKPHYRKGHSIALAFVCLAWVMLATNVIYCAWENKARATGRRDSNITKYETLVRNGKTSAPIGDRAPDFKLTL
ncbi:hypothetical protein MJO28_002191 [Puccinia striiformis f. sp. tritici]|uniref:Uncharacterized protein n=1 Tax=Puccinia striiformis f. sp. tritici TaxID=168172 RepID=A0ACC0EW54_9BASI|nr:hypothetical protein MJO28_002191 [Puccinia striiformis f. sp. tritici]